MNEHPLSEKEIVSAANRPDMREREKGILFHDTGQSGPDHPRDLRAYKKGRVESNFHHLYDKFAGPGEEED